MKTRNIILILIIIFTFINIGFTEKKRFIKQAIEIVPTNQSQDQVIAYLTQKLTRQATEEAGIFITKQFSVENKKITKDEITSIAGSISEITVENKETFTKDNQQYVKVKVNIEVDTDSIQTYLDKILQDNQYKREADELRKKTLELEEKLKTATKKQYEQELSIQVQKQMELQKQRAIELNKMAIQAKEEYAKVEQEQKQKELKRQEEVNALKKKIELDELEFKKKMEQENINIRKQEIENQQRIKELENGAKKSMLNFDKKEKLSVGKVVKEANKLKIEIIKKVNNFDNLLIINKAKIEDNYNKRIGILKERKFLKKEPIRKKYEESLEFKNRVFEYKQEKKDFERETKTLIREEMEKKKEAIINEEEEILKGMVKAVQPFIEKIIEYQKQKSLDEKTKYIKPKDADIKIDNRSLKIYFDFQKKEYTYDFNLVSYKEKDRILIYETWKQLSIKPYFSIKLDKNDKYAPLLLGFQITHLGTNKEYDYKLLKTPQTEDINFYKTILKHIQNYNQINEIIWSEKIKIIKKKKEEVKRELFYLLQNKKREVVK